MPKIYIVNPAPKGCSFTSLNRALRFLASGRANWEVPNKSIRFLHPVTEPQTGEFTGKYIGNRFVWWNGSTKDPGATHKPGERRS